MLFEYLTQTSKQLKKKLKPTETPCFTSPHFFYQPVTLDVYIAINKLMSLIIIVINLISF